MTRKQKLLLNTGTSILKQIIVTVCGFILPRYMLLYYGSAVNGLISSITHFLGFISLLEMGIGPVVQANLYGPLAKKDHEQISKIVISSECFFRKLALIFLAYIAVLSVVFPTVINSDYDAWFSVSLILIIAISTFAQYFFGATYQLLLNADQKAYIQTSLQMGTVILNTAFCIILMRLGVGVHAVKLLTSAIFVLRPLGQVLYVRKCYQLNKKLRLTSEPIKQKWNGFSQHLASVVCDNIDVVVLTFFSTLTSVSVYSVYYNVTNGVTSMIMTAATGLESFFGNMLANGEKAALTKAFETTEWIIHTVVTVIFAVAAITIVPFVSVYTRGITDADYIAPLFAFVLVIAYAAQCVRIPYFRLIKAAGHFKETQNGAFISMGLNIVISVASVFRFGLVGIAFGTLVAMLYHTCYFVWYLRKSILHRPAWHFVKYLLTDALILALSMLLTRTFVMTDISYLSWVLLAVKVGMVTLGTAVFVNGVFYHKVIWRIVKK